ncbi:MAG: hypothetical protein ACM3N0_03060 [Chloroflexota bacterium]
MNRFMSSAVAPALLWMLVALVDTLASLPPASGIALAVLAAICALTLPQRDTRVRAATVLAMIPVAISGAPAWAFVLAGGGLAAVLAQPATAAVPSRLERIQRHLEWCRRRGEPAHLLWVHAPQMDRATATAALDAFRVTDNAALLHEDSGHEEIVAMVDHANFEHDGLERRLRTEIGDGVGFGWAEFPEDGVTLEALFQHARAAAVASSETAESAPRAQPQPSFRRWGSRPHAGTPARSPYQG